MDVMVVHTQVGKKTDAASATGTVHAKLSQLLTVGTLPYLYIPSSNVIASADTAKTTVSESYEQLKSILIGFWGRVTVYFEIANLQGGGMYGKVYKNGVAVGTERVNLTANYVGHSENFSVVPGDTIELWGKTGGSSNANGCRNFRVKGDLVATGDGYSVLLDA